VGHKLNKEKSFYARMKESKNAPKENKTKGSARERNYKK
jgi:hypothetical protein